MFFRPRHTVFPMNKQCRLSLVPLWPSAALCPQDSYTLRVSAFSGLRRYSAKKEGLVFDESRFAFFEQEHPLCACDGTLCLDIDFPQEDRWLCVLSRNGEEMERFEVYSLAEDLFSLIPCKGDNHMHTSYSDGSESPEYRVADYAKRGYDYVVVTDHGCYVGSLVAKKMVDGLCIPYLVIPGEEIHAPGNNVHIINMGGNSGVTEWYTADPQGYETAVRARYNAIEEPLSEKDKWAVASSLEVFDRIHQRGGVAILCHPHWILNGTYQQSEDITNYLFDHRSFDVYEMIAGGAFEVGTQMQISYYHSQPEMPVVGSSDTHRINDETLIPINYTIAFAKSRSAQDICEAVRNGLCVAGHDHKLYGDYRLMRYAYFLLDNYYQQHDAIMAQLGEQLLSFASAGCPAQSPRIEKMRSMPDPLSIFTSMRYTD